MSPMTLEQKIMQVLEDNDGRCLDNEEERQAVCDALFQMMDEHLGWSVSERPVNVECEYCDGKFTLYNSDGQFRAAHRCG